MNSLSEIHHKNVIHRDIKLENIMAKSKEIDYRKLIGK